MILCAGEILADMIGEERDGTFFYERKAGGAPFNVACAVKSFGVRSAFAGSVGDDIIGNFLEKFARSRGLDRLILKKNREANTTLAFVELDKNGERSFCFHRKNTADYDMPQISDEEIAEADIVHIGSLMLSEAKGAEYAATLAKRVRKAGKLVSFDVNYRTDIFGDGKSAERAYKEMLALADIVKLSEDEVGIFGTEYIGTELKDKLVCISLGSAGSEWRYRGESGKVPAIKVKPVDTTGAGDAFYAGVLSRLDGVPRGKWNRDILDGALRFGNVCGALNTLGRGAIDCLPDQDTVKRYLKD